MRQTVSTLLNTYGCGDLVFSYLLRSDMQPTCADAPNPDSHFKRTTGMEDLTTPETFIPRSPVHTRDHRSTAFRHAAQCSHDLFSHRDVSFIQVCRPSLRQVFMEVDGIEPTTHCLQSRCSPTELHPQENTHAQPNKHNTRTNHSTRQGPSPSLARTAHRTWWAREDLNLRPHAYQACALTS
jgi:hypothetical protein